MPKYGRRRVKSALGFETLEDRRLLSLFGGSISPGWEPPGGHGNAPTAVAMISHQSPGPFGGIPSSSAQGQSFSRSGSPPTGYGSMQDQAQPTPASSASSFQHADTLPPQSTALPSAPASSVGTSTGTIAARPTKDAASDDSAFIVTLGYGPWTTTPFAPGVSRDDMGGLQPGAGSGLAQSVSAFMSLASSEAYAPHWAITSGPLPVGVRIVPEPVAVSGIIESSNGPAGITSPDLPAPRGAGLITDLGAFSHGQIDERLTRLFGGLREESGHPAHQYSYLWWIALAVAALETARRWRRQSTQGPRHSRRFRGVVINGLLAMFP